MQNTFTVVNKEANAQDHLFYLEGRGYYQDSHLVTANPGNKDLGINHIRLTIVENPNPKAPLFRVQIRLAHNITVYGSIFRQNKGNGLRLSITQDKSVNAQGTEEYYDVVRLPIAIQAQVLRFASTWTQEVAGVPAPAYAQQPTQGYAPPADYYAGYQAPPAPVAQPQRQAPVQYQAPQAPVQQAQPMAEQVPVAVGAPAGNVSPELNAALEEAMRNFGTQQA